MAETLAFHYDQVDDIFYISKCPPYAEQETEELMNEVIARLNPIAGEVEALEILFFSQQLAGNLQLNLPLAHA